jgi:UDP-glucuronate 4-epimerase
MPKILITGGAGFIGSHLIAALLKEANTEIFCFDNFDHFYSPVLKQRNIDRFKNNHNFKLIKGDILKMADLEKIPAVDAIVHLAATAGVRRSFENAVLYNSVNLTGSANLLKFAARVKATKFVFASTSSIYGSNTILPMTEECIAGPCSPYAISKYEAEALGRSYSQRYHMVFLALRLFSVYGPRQRPDQIVSQLFHAALENQPFVILGSGHSTRDYTFVGDIISGICSALHYNKTNFEIINLGRGKQVILSELLQQVETITGTTIKFTHSRPHPGDAQHTCADISKARDLLRYRPCVDIYEGLVTTFADYLLSTSANPQTWY